MPAQAEGVALGPQVDRISPFCGNCGRDRGARFALDDDCVAKNDENTRPPNIFGRRKESLTFCANRRVLVAKASFFTNQFYYNRQGSELWQLSIN
jgi:hypothetical protein